MSNHKKVAPCKSTPTAINNTNTSATLSGLELMGEDNSDMPLPMGMAEIISNRAEPPKQIGKVEQIEDDLEPEPPASIMEASLINTVKADISNNLTSVNEEQNNPHVPFDSTEDTIAKKKDVIVNHKPAAVSNYEEKEVVLSPSDRDSIYEPPREVIEGREDMSDNTNTGRGGTNRRRWEDIESRDARTHARTDNNDTASSSNNDSMVDTEANVEVSSSTNQEAGDTDIHIPEAFLVEDIEEEVFIAIPTQPWWKQRRTKIFFGVVIVLIGALLVALGVSLSQSNNLGFESTNSTVTVFVTPSPTPPITYACFDADDGGYEGILYDAVRAYVRQNCANNTKCFIAQPYGWPMNSWCVGNVKDMRYLFQYMDTFNENISDWNTSSATDMGYMFFGASSFNGDLSNFDTSSVINMDFMFSAAAGVSGRGIANFDTSSVTSMEHMFSGALSFNGDVSSFNTSSVKYMASMFSGASLFNGEVSNFDTSSVLDMRYMFMHATSFNQDLSNFDTSSVTNMDRMFRHASSFNHDVANFDISSVTDMEFMFEEATSFNQNLCSWRDTFPYTKADEIFIGSNCTYQGTPKRDQKGPFCASKCQS